MSLKHGILVRIQARQPMLSSHFQDGLRIIYKSKNIQVRINLGRVGYIYWEKGIKYGSFVFYKIGRWCNWKHGAL
jgi:hypothetical protein